MVAQFDGAWMTSDGGGLLLRRTNRKIRLLERVAACFTDGRDPARVEHSLAEMLGQRIYGLALGYEDLNDHEQLRHDPLLALLAGKREVEEPLAGKSTLNRMELTPEGQRGSPPSLSQDHLLAAAVGCPAGGYFSGSAQRAAAADRARSGCHRHPAVRPAGSSASSTATTATTVICRCTSSAASICCARGSVPPTRMPARARWKRWSASWARSAGAGRTCKIILRADSGFCREPLMAWCESQHVDYVFGLARNERLEAEIAELLAQAQSQHQQTPASGAGVRRVRLSDAQQLVARPSRGGQGRVSGQGPQPAFRGDLAESAAELGAAHARMSGSTAPAARWKTASRSS